MPAIDVDFREPKEAGRFLQGEHWLHTSKDWKINPIEKGMESGRTSLMVMIPVDVSGLTTWVLAETSLNAWMMATSLLRGRFHEELDEPGFAVMPESVKKALHPRFAEAIKRILQVEESKANELATMFIDSFEAGAPEDFFETP